MCTAMAHLGRSFTTLHYGNAEKCNTFKYFILFIIIIYLFIARNLLHNFS